MKVIIKRLPIFERGGCKTELALFYVEGSMAKKLRIVVREKATIDKTVVFKNLEEIILRNDQVDKFFEAVKDIMGMVEQ